MEIVISAALAAALAGAVAWLLRGRSTSPSSSALPAQEVLHETQRRAEEIRAGAEEIKLAQEEGKKNLARLREQVEQELRERRAEMVRLEERILQREES